MFHVYDLDRDGAITEDDFLRNADRMADLRGVGRGSRTHEAFRASLQRWWEAFSACDADQDGRVTLDDLTTFWAGVYAAVAAEDATGRTDTRDLLASDAELAFALIDVNADGRASAAEYADFLKSWNIRTNYVHAYLRVDPYGKGYLDRDDVRRLVLQFYLGTDPREPGTHLYGPL